MPRDSNSQHPLELLVDGVPTVRGDLDISIAAVSSTWLAHLNSQFVGIDLSVCSSAYADGGSIAKAVPQSHCSTGGGK